MPQIPEYTSNPSVKAPNLPEQSTVAIAASARVGDATVAAIRDTEQSLVKADEFIGKIRGFRQKNEASIYTTDKMAQIASAAEQDIDLTPDKYDPQIDAIGQEAAKNITDPLAKEEFMTDFSRQATAAKYRIKDNYRRKEVDTAKATIDYSGQQIVDNYGAMDDATKITNIASYRKQLENAVALGVYNKPQADEKYAKFTKDLTKGEVNYGILNNPQAVLGELQKGNGGAFPGLSETERADFIKEAETRIEKLDKEEKEAISIATNAREAELIDAKIAGNLTVPQVKKEREAGTIKAGFADSLIKALQSPRTVKAKTQDATYNKLAEYIINPANKPEVIRNELLIKNSTGQLSDEDFQILYAFNQAINNDTIDKTLPKKNLMQTLTFWSDEYATMRPEVKARIFKTYMQRVAQGEAPEVAVKDIINKEVLNNHPQAASYPKEGKKVIDMWGVVKRIMPTGDINDED